MKKLLIMLVTGIMLFSFAGCGSQKETLVIGLDENFPPMGFRDENGKLTGFDIELAEAAAKKMDLNVEFQPIDWSSKELELESGKVNMLWNGLTITPERLENMDFTKPYLANRQIIVVKNDSEVNSKQDLENKNVGVQADSSAFEAVRKDTDSPTFMILTYADNISAFTDLDVGRLDAVVVDEIVARYYLQNNDTNFRIIETDNFGDEEYGVAVKKGDTELLNKLQTALDELSSDGTSSKISEKWFGEDIYMHSTQE